MISIRQRELPTPLIRSTESKILPGKRQQWGDLAKELTAVVGKHGVGLRYAQLVYGGSPNTVISTSLSEDWTTLASRSDAIGADADFQALMTRAANPSPEVLHVGVLEDITAQVGGEPLTPGAAFPYSEVVGSRVMRDITDSL